MDWLLLIVEFASIVAVFLLGLFTKNYLPSYMEKKGENLATKEDVKEITRRTEEVQQLQMSYNEEELENGIITI